MGAEDGPGPDIGYTGARFGGMPRRRARKRAEAARAEEATTDEFPVVRTTDVPDDGDGPVVGYTGARFGGSSRRRRKSARRTKADPAPEPAAVTPPPPLPPLSVPEPAEERSDDASGSSSVRPYVFTRGRTRSQFELSVEALVSIVPSAPLVHLSSEHHAVLELCQEPRSVAEIAALLGVPLGVVRVLVGDMVAAGEVSVHRTAGDGGPDVALMERVLAGLRRL